MRWAVTSFPRATANVASKILCYVSDRDTSTLTSRKGRRRGGREYLLLIENNASMSALVRMGLAFLLSRACSKSFRSCVSS